MNPSSEFSPSARSRAALPVPAKAPRHGPTAVHPPGGGKTPTPPKCSLRILCIDDDEQILETLKDCLAHHGHRVSVASGGKRGLDLFFSARRKAEPYDVVITDLNMPDVDGCEVARQIKAESPGTPVILISGLGITMNRAAFKSAPVDAVVNKPPGMQNLNGLILQLVK